MKNLDSISRRILTGSLALSLLLCSISLFIFSITSLSARQEPVFLPQELEGNVSIQIEGDNMYAIQLKEYNLQSYIQIYKHNREAYWDQIAEFHIDQ